MTNARMAELEALFHMRIIDSFALRDALWGIAKSGKHAVMYIAPDADLTEECFEQIRNFLQFERTSVLFRRKNNKYETQGSGLDDRIESNGQKKRAG